MGKLADKLQEKVERGLSKIIPSGDEKALRNDLMESYRPFFSWLKVSARALRSDASAFFCLLH